MPPLTTITILVYDLVKVNPTSTLCLPSAIEKVHKPVSSKKADELLWLTKKNRANN